MRRDSSDASGPSAVARLSPATMKNRGSLMPKSPEEKAVDDAVERVNAARTLGDEKRNEVCLLRRNAARGGPVNSP